MELKLHNEQGKSAASVAASDALFGREFNESLAPDSRRLPGERPPRYPRAKGAQRRPPLAQEALAAEGHGACAAGDVASPLWRGGGKIFPNLPDENFSHKVNRKMYRAGMCSILSQLAGKSA